MIFINGVYTKEILDFSLKRQFQQIAKSAVAGVLMLIAIFSLNLLHLQWPTLLILVGKILVGAGVYLSCSYFLELRKLKRFSFGSEE